MRVKLFRSRTLKLLLLLALSCFILAMQNGIVRFYRVISESMSPTLESGDRVLVGRDGNVRRGAVVIFPDPEEGKDLLVKRIVALGEDRVEIRDGLLYINGSRELNSKAAMQRIKHNDFSIVVEKGHMFVLGDNRNRSSDSLDFGSVPVKQVSGFLKFVIWPPVRWL